MKKLLFAAAVFAALVMGSCEHISNVEITIKNSTGYPIKAAITQSKMSPSSSATISAGSSATFSGIESGGNYYPHVALASTTAFITTDDPIAVTASATWTITYSGGRFTITHP